MVNVHLEGQADDYRSQHQVTRPRSTSALDRLLADIELGRARPSTVRVLPSQDVDTLRFNTLMSGNLNEAKIGASAAYAHRAKRVVRLAKYLYRPPAKNLLEALLPCFRFTLTATVIYYDEPPTPPANLADRFIFALRTSAKNPHEP